MHQKCIQILPSLKSHINSHQSFPEKSIVGNSQSPPKLSSPAHQKSSIIPHLSPTPQNINYLSSINMVGGVALREATSQLPTKYFP